MSNDLVVSNLDQMMRMAHALKSARGFIPEHLQTEGQILATILAGQELGLGPMAAMRGLHIVKGKVGADYSLWVALLKRNGYSVEWLESSAEKVILRLTDRAGKVHTETWDKARATLAGLWGSGMGWTKYPETMLRARAVTSAGRSFAAEVMAGSYSLDELEEMKPTGWQPAIAEEPIRRIEEKPAADFPVQLDLPTVVGGMTESTTLEELEGWAQQAVGLNQADKKEARAVYGARRDVLRKDAELLAAERSAVERDA